MRLHNIPGLMNEGKPVTVLFTEKEGEPSSLLYCELIQKARYGESFLIRNQGCEVGAYVLGETDLSPEDYYYNANRYRDRNAAKNAVSNLHRLEKKANSIKIAPYSGGDFNILLLFVKPEAAMHLVQAYTYRTGDPVNVNIGGIASVCSECTAYPLQGKLGISPGCKGSRKHTGYANEELVVGIPFRLAGEIDTNLGRIPRTLE